MKQTLLIQFFMVIFFFPTNGDIEIGHLSPLPFNRESLKVLSENIKELRELNSFNLRKYYFKLTSLGTKLKSLNI